MLWLLPLGALLGACTQEEASGDSGNSCTEDSECPDKKVCEEGRCVWWESTTGSGGSGSGSGSSTGSGGVAPDASALCEEYLGCLAAVSPESVPDALAAFGPDGSCWSGGAEIEAACGQACAQGMKDYHYADATACPACHVDADCPNGVCAAGSCGYVLPVPDTSATCAACVGPAALGPCSEAASACGQDPECVATADCFAVCNGDVACAEQCPDPYATGYVYYWACTMCEQCPTECAVDPWCQLGKVK